MSDVSTFKKVRRFLQKCVQNYQEGAVCAGMYGDAPAQRAYAKQAKQIEKLLSEVEKEIKKEKSHAR